MRLQAHFLVDTYILKAYMNCSGKQAAQEIDR